MGVIASLDHNNYSTRMRYNVITSVNICNVITKVNICNVITKWEGP
jgi:hypothetical protein